MKRLLLHGIALCLCVPAFAQYQKVKLTDVVQQHEQSKKQNQPGIFSIYENPEKDEYQFNRWKWYWSQHTDAQGYLVPRIHAKNVWSAYVQEHPKSAYKGTADQSKWRSLGPNVQTGAWLGFSQDGIGRINTMAFHPTDPEIFVVGTAGGGLWVTTDMGGSWDVVTEDLMSPAVSDFDFNPLNPNTMYMCTGDVNAIPQFSSNGFNYNSMGLLKSIDGGDTWDSTGLAASVNERLRTNSLLINPVDTNTLTIATAKKILKSFDGGDNWIDVTPAMPTDEVVYYIPEIVYKPGDTTVIYAPITTADTSIGMLRVRFMMSANSGMSWVTTGVVNNATRAAMAVTPSDPDLVKVVVSNTADGLEGIYHSGNSGASYVKVFDDNNCTTNILASAVSGRNCGGQGYYDLCIAIDPRDDLHVVVGGVNSWESHDGGVSWNILTQWANEQSGIPMVHADHHYLGYHPLVDSFLYDCNDGGISVFMPNPLNGKYGWIDIAPGMNITQYYRNAVTGKAPFVIGGAQDNGSNMLSLATGISTSAGPGDGMECQIDPVDPNIIYVGSQNGGFFKWDLSKGMTMGNLNSISDNIPGAPSGAWTTPMIINPHDHNNLIAGYNTIYSSPDQGETWTDISPQFSNLIYRLAMSMNDAGTIYATEERSKNIHYTTDSGATWTTIQPPYDEPRISDIKADHSDAGRIWITFPGYGQNKNKIATYSSGSWTTMDENLPDLPVYCIEQDTSNGTLYIGTYTGVYYRTLDMKQWELFDTELPLVSIMDLGINYVTGELIAATWGRGMYASPKYEEELSIPGGVPYALDVITVYPNPGTGHFIIADAAGYFSDKEVNITLTDVAGRVVWSSEAAFTGNKLAIDAHAATGNYLLSITSADGKTARTRLTVIK